MVFGRTTEGAPRIADIRAARVARGAKSFQMADDFHCKVCAKQPRFRAKSTGNEYGQRQQQSQKGSQEAQEGKAEGPAFHASRKLISPGLSPSLKNGMQE